MCFFIYQFDVQAKEESKSGDKSEEKQTLVEDLDEIELEEND